MDFGDGRIACRQAGATHGDLKEGKEHGLNLGKLESITEITNSGQPDGRTDGCRFVAGGREGRAVGDAHCFPAGRTRCGLSENMSPHPLIPFITYSMPLQQH